MICITLADATAFAIGALGKGRRRVNSFASEVDEGGYTDPPATYSVHGDMRTIASVAKKSVHGASSVVSTAAGRLYGFLVVRAGTGAKSITVYDNASAGSGTVLRSVTSAELVRGAWIYCGAHGLVAANGLYVTLAGTQLPIVLAFFEGSYPTVSHSGTLRHIDGTDGNDAWDGTTEAFVSGTTGPRKTWPTSWTTGSWHVKCKRGTTIDIPDSGLTHGGTDWLVEDYGDPEAAKPILRQSASKTSVFNFDATSGVVEFRNLRMISLLSTRKSGGGFNVPAGARCICTNTEADNFTTGHLFNGEYSVLDGGSTTNCTYGAPQSNNDYTAPSYGLVMNSTLVADSDVYSLHNGIGVGVGNVCVSSTLTMDPDFVPGTGGIEPENCADINGTNNAGGMYYDTLMAFCTLTGGVQEPSTFGSPRAFACGDDGDGIGLIACIINAGIAVGAQLRAANMTVTGNVIRQTMASGAPVDVGTAANLKLYGNYLLMTSNSTKAMVTFSGASSGEAKNNLLVSSSPSQRIIDMGSGVIAGWGAGKWATNDYWAPGITNTTTFANITGGGGAQRLSTFSAAYAAGSELNVNPSLDADYRPPSDSALIGAGTNLGVCYMGFDGPFWQAGPPTVGATELQR